MHMYCAPLSFLVLRLARDEKQAAVIFPTKFQSSFSGRLVSISLDNANYFFILTEPIPELNVLFTFHHVEESFFLSTRLVLAARHENTANKLVSVECLSS